MFQVAIVGASGYVGAELAKLVLAHPKFELHTIAVSAGSADEGRNLADLHGQLYGQIDMPLSSICKSEISLLASQVDLIFLATPHQVSHDWVPSILGKRARVFDLSGAYRLSDLADYEKYYGFTHQYPAFLEQAVYGLVDWYKSALVDSQWVSVPGCYPTASLTALLPLTSQGLNEQNTPIIINAVSGVSGAGRKAAVTNSYCEVSLQAYGIGQHRHQPEISQYLNQKVIFTPHLGAFKRGILATCVVKLADGVTNTDIAMCYTTSYQNNPLVRIRATSPKLDDVVNTPFCDLHWQLSEDGQHIIVVSAIDNLLKGAASQALQCANLSLGIPQDSGLTEGFYE